MNSPDHPAKLEQLQNEIETLSSDITLAKAQLGFSSPIPSPNRDTSRKSSSSASPPTKSRFSRLTYTFKRATSPRKNKEGYQNIDSQTLLTPRRGSEASEITLVDRESATFLLGVLAPLVSTLQKIGLCLTQLGVQPADDLGKVFSNICGKLESLIESLHMGEGNESGEEDVEAGDDLEMRALLLSALLKKIEAERARLTSPPTQALATISPSPLTLGSRNPFIVHSTSLTSTSSASKPITPAPASHLSPSYATFVSNSQTSWTINNVFRLGSYQASMLFSPSPIAVRKLGMPGVRA